MLLFLLVVPALASIAIIAHYQLGTRIDADNIFFCSYELMIRRVEGWFGWPTNRLLMRAINVPVNTTFHRQHSE